MRHRKSILALAAAAGIAALVATAACTADSGGGESPSAQERRPQVESREARLEAVAAAAEAYPEASGAAAMTVDDATTVELEVAGLRPDTAYTSHLHDAACENDPPGGGHWLASPEEGPSEGNEVHLRLTTDAEGRGSVNVESDLVADGRVESIVVHLDTAAAETGHEHPASDRVLCGDFG